MLIAKHMLVEYPGDYHLEGVDMSGTDLSEAKLGPVAGRQESTVR